MNLYGLEQLVESARTLRKNTILIAKDENVDTLKRKGWLACGS